MISAEEIAKEELRQALQLRTVKISKRSTGLYGWSFSISESFKSVFGFMVPKWGKIGAHDRCILAVYYGEEVTQNELNSRLKESLTHLGLDKREMNVMIRRYIKTIRRFDLGVANENDLAKLRQLGREIGIEVVIVK